MAAGYGRRAGTGEQSLCVTAQLLVTLQNSLCLWMAEIVHKTEQMIHFDSVS